MKNSIIGLISIAMISVALGQEQACTRNSFGVFENISCAVEARDIADKELNATYQRLLAVLAPGEAKVLREAQRAWLSFVEADAKFVFEREGDGSSGRLVAVNNRERLIRERIKALNAWLPR